MSELAAESKVNDLVTRLHARPASVNAQTMFAAGLQTARVLVDASCAVSVLYGYSDAESDLEFSRVLSLDAGADEFEQAWTDLVNTGCRFGTLVRAVIFNSFDKNEGEFYGPATPGFAILVADLAMRKYCLSSMFLITARGLSMSPLDVREWKDGKPVLTMDYVARA